MRSKKASLYFFILMIFMIGIWTTQSYSLNENTHRAINEEVAQRVIDGFSLDSYLKSHLGFKSGIEDEFLKDSDKKTVLQWLGEGGFQEDRPGSKIDYILGRPTRSVNHFHNPLLPWDQSGLDDSVFGISFTGQSSVLWSQRPIGTQSPGGYYSWHDAREYFYRALTSGSQTDREKNFADTFRAVGQLMHLVEDASVPMHTRNDIHILYSYEGYVDNIRNGESGTFDSWIVNPITFDKSNLDLPKNPLAEVPIAKIIDTDQYIGINPGITASTAIGIAEYTNANFLSEDTMFTADFSYPDWSSVVEYDEVFNGKNRTYLRKLGSAEGGYGESIGHLAVGRWFYKYLPSSIKNKGLKLDDNCYANYASLLIPRAVGYSAGLLNYFFRGTLEITPPDQIAYAVTDGSQTPYYDEENDVYHQQFTSIKAKVRNITIKEELPDGTKIYEDMQNGILQAVAKYKIIPNYMYDFSWRSKPGSRRNLADTNSNSNLQIWAGY